MERYRKPEDTDINKDTLREQETYDKEEKPQLLTSEKTRDMLETETFEDHLMDHCWRIYRKISIYAYVAE